jgi:lipopolysaccharide transport system ATP-binding protein
MPLVEFDGVAKRYRLGPTQTSLPSLVSNWTRARLGLRHRAGRQEDLWALRDVSFRLGAGDSLALLGANGAGKTTVLKLAANITKPTTGRVDINGRLSALIELGAGFHPDLTGRDNAFLNGTILGISRKELVRRFEDIVEFSGLERFIDTPVKRYSSGMIVRLGFAVAACIEPEVLLVDEVLAVGDVAFSQKCLARITALIQKGTAILFVSHNFYLVKAMCRRSIYLRSGRVVQDGETMDVIHAYERDVQAERAARMVSGESARASQAGGIEITGVEVVTADGVVNPDEVSSRDPILLRIRYAAFEDLGRVQVSVFLRRADGLLCSVVRSRLERVDLVVQRGEGVVTLAFDRLQLATGAYHADAYFLNETDSLVITPGGRTSAWFGVAGVAHEQNDAVFEPQTRWSHEPAPSSVSA